MMGEKLLVALVLAAGLVTSTAIHVYFSPFQTCLRGGPKTTEGQPNVAWCTRANGGWGGP